jgi:hypothetical protein
MSKINTKSKNIILIYFVVKNIFKKHTPPQYQTHKISVGHMSNDYFLKCFFLENTSR